MKLGGEGERVFECHKSWIRVFPSQASSFREFFFSRDDVTEMGVWYSGLSRS